MTYFYGKPRHPWVVLESGQEVIIESGKQKTTSFVKMSKLGRGYFFVGAVATNGSDPIRVTITAKGYDPSNVGRTVVVEWCRDISSLFWGRVAATLF